MARKPSKARLFVAARLHLSNAEIFEQAKRARVGVKTKNAISHLRNRLKKAGVTEAQIVVKRKKKQPAAAPRLAPPPTNPKEAMIRRLFFEVGFDAAKRLYLEFESYHDRMFK